MIERSVSTEDIVAAAACLVKYEPETGVFTWNDNITITGKAYPGAVAGSVNGKGYWRIGVMRGHVAAHVLAHFIMTGSMPMGVMDHINGDPCDNRWSNLRVVSLSANAQNRKKSKPGKHGFVGAYQPKGSKKYQSRIKLNGVVRHLGTFNTAKDASDAYLKAKSEVHPFSHRHKDEL